MRFASFASTVIWYPFVSLKQIDLKPMTLFLKTKNIIKYYKTNQKM